MPLDAEDVISTLLDPVLQRIDFWVQTIHVRGEAYLRIAKLVEEDQILVVSGDNPNRSAYDKSTDTITTPGGDSPPSFSNRGSIVHESTHAIADMEFASVTWHTNEVCAYIAQNVYLGLLSPAAQLTSPPYAKNSIIPWIQRKGLDKRPGAGLRFNMDDIAPLMRDLNHYPSYHRDAAQMNGSNGISTKPRKSLDIRSDEPTSVRSGLFSQLAYRSPVNIPFDFQRYDINAAAADVLTDVAEFIKARKGLNDKIYLTGYADGIGDATHNLQLSRLRAEAVSRWLVHAKVVDTSEVIILGKGWDDPMAPNRSPTGTDDPDGRAKNRRVEVLIM